MKVLKSLLLIAVLVLQVSCSSDDDGASVIPLTTANISGVYALVFSEATIVHTQIVNEASVITTRKYATDTFTNSNYTFNINGNYTARNYYRETVTSTVNVTGNVPIVISTIVNDDLSGSYTFNDTNRTITFLGATYTVAVFNDNELILTRSDTEMGENNATKNTDEELRFTR